MRDAEGVGAESCELSKKKKKECFSSICRGCLDGVGVLGMSITLFYVPGTCRFNRVEENLLFDASSLGFRGGAPAGLEIHAVAARLLVLDHLEVLCAQSKRLQDAVTQIL